jgi:hypothetical protein
MAQNKITFPVIKGTNVRRNAETGIEIHNDGPDGWIVRTFHADKGDMFDSFRTLKAARAYAEEEVELMREVIAMAYDEATEMIIAELAAVAPEVEAFGNRALSALHWSATHAVVRPLFAHLPSTAASASRLHRIRAVLAGTEVMISDAEADAALADALAKYTVGAVVHSHRHDGAAAVVTSEAFLIAESNEVVLQVRVRGVGYASVYARDLVA